MKGDVFYIKKINKKIEFISFISFYFDSIISEYY